MCNAAAVQSDAACSCYSRHFWMSSPACGYRALLRLLSLCAAGHWELEHDVLAGELLVHGAVRLQLVLHRVPVLRVQVHLPSDTVQ